MRAKGAARIAIAFVAAVLVTAVLGSVVQTQINLAAITRLGGDVTPALRLRVTGQDLMGFGPVMAAIAAGAFLPAFAAAMLARRLTGVPALPVFAAAGMTGLWAAFEIMAFFTPMPTLVAAVRGTAGLLAVAATGLAGGLVFAGLRRDVQDQSA